jgi:putative endonuclease
MNKLLGQIGEDLVADYYSSLGYKLVEKNYITPFGKQIGELDLIVKKNNELVFVEVKTRTSNRFGGPFEAVDQNKQKKLVKTAKMYLKLHEEFQNFSIRFDVAAVDFDNTAQPVIILMNVIEDYD